MERSTLTAYLDDYLRIAEIEDYGPQGLQVEADNTEIRRIALGVDTSPEIIIAAAEWQADMLLVHHGVLWRNVEPIAGPLGNRVRLLMRHGINLYAAHLALDAHPEVGNNAVLARLLDLQIEQWWCAPTGTPIGVYGSLAAALGRDQFAGDVAAKLQTSVRVLEHGPSTVRQVAIVSGAAADEAGSAYALGADTFLTGETSHSHYWAASDYGINVIFGGHYATEAVGVKALGDHLARQHRLETRFFDFPTGM
jgi:dinuclear metal center YbgI/SA1388 family protein